MYRGRGILDDYARDCDRGHSRGAMSLRRFWKDLLVGSRLSKEAQVGEKSRFSLNLASILIHVFGDVLSMGHYRWRERGEFSTVGRVDYRRRMGDDGLVGSRPRRRGYSMDGYWWLDRWSSNGEHQRLNGDQSLVDAMVGRAKGMWLGNLRKAVVAACDHNGRVVGV
ncbi:hypothetical protein L6452_32771 [Arctium lappa]|uniref:Uncharacterized protein n=1 Tax=Arctium lappa TaxID=4217 RepID=A0ACB8Z5G4_ARCLA|nr:hypothetical protein L6452_32771 [Arctium lappa]